MKKENYKKRSTGTTMNETHDDNDMGTIHECAKENAERTRENKKKKSRNDE